MIPGEYRLQNGQIELNRGRTTITIRVANKGDRPIQVGSHFHFAEVNPSLAFSRKKAIGMRLNIPAGTAIRFEPGEEMEVELVEIGGNKKIFGLNGISNGPVTDITKILQVLKEKGFV